MAPVDPKKKKVTTAARPGVTAKAAPARTAGRPAPAPPPRARPVPPPPAPSTAVARRPAAAVSGVPDYGEDSGGGFEDMTRDDFAIPFLVILQAQSPAAMQGSPGYVEGAQAGHLFNTVTKELHAEAVIIPVFRTHSFIEWVPRDSGGGFVGVHAPDDPEVQKLRQEQGRFGRLKKEDGNEIVETFSVFGLHVKEDGSPEQVILNFSSTGVKTYRQWMTRAANVVLRGQNGAMVRPPLWAHRFRIGTQFQQNDQGSWYNWTVDWDGADATEARLDPGSALYAEARAFRAVAASEGLRAVKTSAKAAEGMAQGSEGEDEVPDDGSAL